MKKIHNKKEYKKIAKIYCYSHNITIYKNKNDSKKYFVKAKHHDDSFYFVEKTDTQILSLFNMELL